MRRLTKELISNSQSAFLIAIEIYNKPGMTYRNQSFAMLLTNAWELLLKAHLYHQSDGRLLSIFRSKRPGIKRESITIDEALAQVFPEERNKIKANIKFVSEIRNEATHLVIDEFSVYYSRAYQASVINYLAKLNEWFGVDETAVLPPGMLALVSAEQIPDMITLKKKYSAEDFKTLLDWQQGFQDLQTLGGEAAISIEHKIALVKNAGDADVILSPGNSGAGVTIIERPKPVDETHPYRTNDVMKAVNDMLTAEKAINLYDLAAYIYVHGTKNSNNDRHWKTRYSQPQYSELMVMDIYQALEQSPTENEKWRKQYLSHQRQRRKK